jgi:hypothetical protein
MINDILISLVSVEYFITEQKLPTLSTKWITGTTGCFFGYVDG